MKKKEKIIELEINSYLSILSISSLEYLKLIVEIELQSREKEDKFKNK